MATESDLVQEALADATAFTKALLEDMPGALCVVDENLHPVIWNKNFGLHMSVQGQDVRQVNMMDYFRPEDLPRIKENIEKTFAGEQTSLECDFMGKDGPVPFAFNAGPVMLGGKRHIIVIGTDLSALRR